MSTSPKLKWPFPDAQDPAWFDKFVSMVSAMDATGYAGREDRNVTVMQGGTVSWNATSGLLSWSADINIHSPVSGFLETIVSGSITVGIGQCWYVNLSRSPSATVVLESQIANSIPNTNDALLLAVRNGSSIYFRNGSALLGTSSAPIFDGGTGSGGGGGPSVDVQDEGIGISNNPHTTLNFVGDGVTVSDAGSGVAEISIPGVPNLSGLTTSMSYFEDFIGNGSVAFRTVAGGGSPIAELTDTNISSYIGTGLLHVDGAGDFAIVAISGSTASSPYYARPVSGAPSAYLSCEFRLKVNDDETSVGSSTRVDVLVGTFPIGFSASRFAFGNANWWVQTPSGNFDSGVAVDSLAPHRFLMTADPTGPLMKFYIDGVQVKSEASSLPGFAPQVALTCDDNGSNDVLIDYVTWQYSLNREI